MVIIHRIAVPLFVGGALHVFIRVYTAVIVTNRSGIVVIIATAALAVVASATVVIVSLSPRLSSRTGMRGAHGLFLQAAVEYTVLYREWNSIVSHFFLLRLFFCSFMVTN